MGRNVLQVQEGFAISAIETNASKYNQDNGIWHISANWSNTRYAESSQKLAVDSYLNDRYNVDHGIE